MQALVTGGGGFLGGAICRQLLAAGWKVRSLQRSAVPELAAQGVDCRQGDITNADTVREAASGCDAIFHTAAKAGVWGAAQDYERINIRGTEHVLTACRTLQIPRLIYTSSPSVVYAGRDEAGIDESTPYPATYLTHYPRTKAHAERAVLAANCATLRTVALRPHLIWGPGDNHLVPRLLERSRSGKLRRVGRGSNLVDTVYVDNAAEAHLLAADRLQPDSPVCGKAYFITNGEPVPLWNLIDRMLDCGGEPPVKRSISASAAYAIGAALETTYALLGRSDEPPMTRFVARQLSTAHWYDISAARRDFGYTPRITVQEGLLRLREWLQSQAPR